MTIHDSLMKIKKKWPDMNPPNPFPSNFLIFKEIDNKSTYGLDDNNLWSIFNEYFENLAIAKPIPHKGYEYIYNGNVYTVNDDGDKALCVWHKMCDKVGWYCKANYNRWKHIIEADTAEYEPIQNYNMNEYSGSTGVSARMRSSVGTIETKSGVAPYNSSNEDLSVTIQSQKTLRTDSEHETEFDSESSISGYDDDSKSLSWDNEITTPEGNTTSVSHIVRKGNIGVTTSQQMIASEYELRKYNVLQEFMNEVAKYSLILDWNK